MNTLKMYGIEESAVYHSRRESFKKNKSDIFNLETHCVSYGFGTVCTKSILLCYTTQHLSLGTFGQNRPRESTVSTKYRG